LRFARGERGHVLGWCGQADGCHSRRAHLTYATRSGNQNLNLTDTAHLAYATRSGNQNLNLTDMPTLLTQLDQETKIWILLIQLDQGIAIWKFTSFRCTSFVFSVAFCGNEWNWKRWWTILGRSFVYHVVVSSRVQVQKHFVRAPASGRIHSAVWR